MSEIIGGWDPDLENRAELEATSYEGWVSQVEGLYGAPEQIDPRPWHKIHNQAQQGACRGHSGTSNGEMCFNIATGAVQQFSRQAFYIWTQRKDGITGDRGSTIGGGEWIAKNVGFCLESLWPYTGKYVTKPPGDEAACKADAAKRKIRTTAAMRSYADCFKWLSAGLGGIDIGIIWNASMHNRGVIESYNPSGRGGGHAVAFLGYSTRKDAKGRSYLWLVNSWGTAWGQGGYAEVAPAAIDAMFTSKYTVCRGMSDMAGEDLRPRPVNFATEVNL